MFLQKLWKQSSVRSTPETQMTMLFWDYFKGHKGHLILLNPPYDKFVNIYFLWKRSSGWKVSWGVRAPRARARQKCLQIEALLVRARARGARGPLQGKPCFSKFPSQIDFPKSEHWKLVSAKGFKILGPKMDAIRFFWSSTLKHITTIAKFSLSTRRASILGSEKWKPIPNVSTVLMSVFTWGFWPDEREAQSCRHSSCQFQEVVDLHGLAGLLQCLEAIAQYRMLDDAGFFFYFVVEPFTHMIFCWVGPTTCFC